MKFIALAALLVLSASALAASDETTDSETQAQAAKVEMCAGGCETQVNQTNINYSPREVKGVVDQVLDPGMVVNPAGSRVMKEQGQDI